MDPGGIPWLRWGAHAAWLAGIGSALTPIARRFAQGHVCGTPVHLREEHRKGRFRDRRIGGDRGEIERDQSTAQGRGARLSREEINALTVAEKTLRIFIKRVVLLRQKNNDVSKHRASERCEKYEKYECLMQSDYLRGRSDIQRKP